MQYCNHCKVNISTKTEVCPLCHNKLDGDVNECVQTFPKYEKPLKKEFGITKLIINILAPLAIFVTVLINLLTFSGVLWSLIDVFGIIYLWIFGLWTFTKDGNIGKKIVGNAVAINIVIVAVNIFGYNLSTLPGEFWSLTYVTPFLLSSAMLANNIIGFTKLHDLREFLFSQFSLCFVIIGVAVLAMCGFSSILFPFFIALGITVATILLFALFGTSVIKQELKKRFHI